MKKIIILSIVAAAVLFTGCGEDSKKSATEAAAKAVESTKEAAHNIADAAKEATNTAVEKAKEAEIAVKETADKAMEATKEAATETKKAAEKAVGDATTAVDKAIGTSGKEAYAKCAGCHGVDGKTKALGKSPEIAGEAKDDVVAKLKEYKAGTRNAHGMGNLMKGQIASMDDATIEAVAAYISTLK